MAQALIPEFGEYVRQEAEAVLSGEKLLAPEQVMARLRITRKQLQTLHRGENPRGLYLSRPQAGQEDHSLPSARCPASGVGVPAGRVTAGNQAEPSALRESVRQVVHRVLLRLDEV